MSVQIIKINGTAIKTPHELTVERYNLTKSGRVASGKMTMDLVAKKRKLNLSYEVISGEDFQQILDLIDTEEMFFTVEWLDHKGWQKATCYVGAIPNTYFRRNQGWYYKNVKFALIEQ